MATMEQILAAIKNAEGDDLKAFKNALGISESDTSPSGDGSELKKEQYQSLQKQYELTAQYGKMKQAQYEAEKLNLIDLAESYKANNDLASDALIQAEELIDKLKSGEQISLGSFDLLDLDDAIDKVAELGELEENKRKALTE